MYTADALARPKLKNTKQCNGKEGCDWCLHPGKKSCHVPGFSIDVEVEGLYIIYFFGKIIEV